MVAVVVVVVLVLVLGPVIDFDYVVVLAARRPPSTRCRLLVRVGRSCDGLVLRVHEDHAP